MSEQGAERRRADRIPERCRVSYRRIRDEGADPKQHAAETINLSASGLCLRAAEAIAADTHVGLELELAGHDAPVVAIGRVVWCDQEAERYRIGICFTWLRDEDRKALAVIAEYVQSQL